MRRLFTGLTAAFAVVAFSSMVLAQAPAAAAADKKVPAVGKVAAQAEKVPAKAEKMEKKAAKTAPSAQGKVAKFDDATKTLTVTTKKGDEDFMLTGDTKIMAGTKAATTADLAAGKNVKVAYTEADGKMTATKVTIAPAKKAPAKKEAEPKKEAEKK